MERSLKRFIITVLIILVLLPIFLTYAVVRRNASIDYWHPASQPGTVWQSTDKRMTFIADSSGNVILSAETEYGTVEIEMYMSQIPLDISFSEISDQNNEETEERWLAWGGGIPRSKSKYVVNVSYVSPADPILSTLFEPGDVIVFRKIDTSEQP